MQQRQLFLFSVFILLVVGSLVAAAAATYKKLGGPAPVGNIVTFMGGKGKQYCGVSNGKDIQCNFEGSTDDTTQFVVEDLNDGTFALKSMTTGQYCHDMGDKIVCHSDVVGAHEKFHWIDQSESKFSLTGPKSGKKRHFCADEGERIVCNRPKAGDWEIFTIGSSNPLPVVITSEDTVTVTDIPALMDTSSFFSTDTPAVTVTSSSSKWRTTLEEEEEESDSQSLWQRFLQFLFSFQT